MVSARIFDPQSASKSRQSLDGGAFPGRAWERGPAADRAGRDRRFRQGLVVVAAVLGIAGWSHGAQAAGIAWQKDIQQALRESARQRRPVLVLVDARWCGACRRMLQQTFPDPALVARISSQFIPVRIDADEQPALVQSLKVGSMPTVLVISPDRRVIGRMTGYQSAAQLDGWLARFKPAQPTAAPKPRIESRRTSDVGPPVPRPPQEVSPRIPMPPDESFVQFGLSDTLDAATRFSIGG
jgi:hypothetical protein